MEYWRVRGSGSFQRSLIRMGRYEDFIARELAARGMPPSLRFLPVIEAAYNPTALSHAGAGGLWQFMPATARWLGLEVGSLVDERFDPYASTPRAFEYLARLHKQFDSWFLALAAYNSGPGRVERIIREHARGPRPQRCPLLEDTEQAAAGDSELRPQVPGCGSRRRGPGQLRLGRLRQGPAPDLRLGDGARRGVAGRGGGGRRGEGGHGAVPQPAAGARPHAGGRLHGGATADRGGTDFAERFAAVPASERVTFREHTVAAGETLYGIAPGSTASRWTTCWRRTPRWSPADCGSERC